MPTQKQRERFLARARSIHKRAEALHFDMIDVFGEEHVSTDYSDNLTVATDDLIDILDKPSLNMWRHLK